MAEANVGASVYGPQYEDFNQTNDKLGHGSKIEVPGFHPTRDALLSFGEGPYMTLLDLLAGQIMSGLVVNRSGADAADAYAEDAYHHAAAMLRVRKKYIEESNNA